MLDVISSLVRGLEIVIISGFVNHSSLGCSSTKIVTRYVHNKIIVVNVTVKFNLRDGSPDHRLL